MTNYSTIMQELGIPIITGENTQKCYFNSVKIQKEEKTGLKVKNLQGFFFNPLFSYLLRYQDGYWIIKISSLNFTKTKKEENSDAVNVCH